MHAQQRVDNTPYLLVEWVAYLERDQEEIKASQARKRSKFTKHPPKQLSQSNSERLYMCQYKLKSNSDSCISKINAKLNFYLVHV